MFDFTSAGLPAEDDALCRFAVKITLDPGSMGQGDVDALRQRGWSDEQISLATQVIAYFNYINRIADALGVAPEDWMAPGHDEWEQRRLRDYSGVLRDWDAERAGS